MLNITDIYHGTELHGETLLVPMDALTPTKRTTECREEALDFFTTNEPQEPIDVFCEDQKLKITDGHCRYFGSDSARRETITARVTGMLPDLFTAEKRYRLSRHVLNIRDIKPGTFLQANTLIVPVELIQEKVPYEKMGTGDQALVDRYAHEWNASFPPIGLSFNKDGVLCLLDGNHRLAAVKLRNIPWIKASVSGRVPDEFLVQ